MQPAAMVSPNTTHTGWTHAPQHLHGLCPPPYYATVSCQDGIQVFIAASHTAYRSSSTCLHLLQIVTLASWVALVDFQFLEHLLASASKFHPFVTLGSRLVHTWAWFTLTRSWSTCASLLRRWRRRSESTTSTTSSRWCQTRCRPSCCLRCWCSSRAAGRRCSTRYRACSTA